MNGILKVAKQNLKMFFKKPISLLFLVAPILISMMAQNIFNVEEAMVTGKIGVVLQESGINDLLIKGLKEKNLEIISYEDQAALQEDLKKGKLDVGLLQNQEGKMSFKAMSAKDDARANHILELVKGMLGELKVLAEVSKDEKDLQRLYHQVEIVKPGIQSANMSKDLTKMSMTFSFFIMIFVMTAASNLSPLIAQKEGYVYERMMTTPLKKYQYMLGHLLAAFTICFFQIILQLIGMKSLGVDFNLQGGSFIAIGIVLCMVGLSISLCVLSFSKSTTLYYYVIGIGITPLCMLSDTFFPVSFFPEWLRRISYLSPLTWVMKGYKGMLDSQSFIIISQYLLVALLIAMVLILISLVRENHISENR